YVFRAVMHGAYWSEGLVSAMKRSGARTVGLLALSDAYGEAFVQGVGKQAEAAGIKVTAVERFTRADTSATAQALKVTASNPDAILVVAVGAGAAMPHLAVA